jgi:flagellar protein FliS
MNYPHNQYQKMAVTTASKEKILLMLYEGAMRHVKLAIKATEENKIAAKGKSISKANAIISELMATLDFAKGGSIAGDLENLYIFMIDKLIEGNIKNDVEALKSVDRILSTLYVAWKDVIENPRDDGVPSPVLQPEEYQKHLESNPTNPASAPQRKGSFAV